MYELVVTYYACTHKNYDEGGDREARLATFSTEKKANVYLKNNKAQLQLQWDGCNASFEVRKVRKAEKVPHDPV